MDRRWHRLFRRLLSVRQALLFPNRLTAQLDAVSVMDNAIADRVCDGGVADGSVPVIGAELAGNDGRGELVSVLNYLEHATGFGARPYSRASRRDGRPHARRGTCSVARRGCPSLGAS